MLSDVEGRLRRSRRIAVVKLRFVGDNIWTLLFLENLKANLPDAAIAVVANAGIDDFYHHNDYVDRVIPYPNREIKKGGMAGARASLRFLRDLRSFKPDCVIDLTDSDKAAAVCLLSGAGTRIGFYQFNPALRHRLLNHAVEVASAHWVPVNFELLEKLGLAVVHREIHNRTPESAFAALRRQCPSVFETDGRKKVLVHPGARVVLRQWGAAKFAELCDLLAARYRVFLTAGPDEAPLLEEVQGLMKTAPEWVSSSLGLQEFAALAQLCDLFVGNDSGPIHIAATKTFVVGIYGPNSDEYAGPWTPRKFIFEKDALPCRRGCSHNECSNESYHLCMTWLAPAAVCEKVCEVLDGAHPAADGDRELKS